jgi:FkbM family methyltransferase
MNVGPVRKFHYLRSVMRNWPVAIIDKLGLRTTCTYRTRSGLTIICRTRTADVNEAVAVLSGLEYPPHRIFVDDGGVVLDVGAHIGAFCLLLSERNQMRSYRGYAFEPAPDNVRVLRANLFQNGLGNIEVIEAAVGLLDGVERFSSGSDTDAGKLDRNGNSLVLTTRLSTFCADRDIDRISLLKLDIEGLEYAVLEQDNSLLSAAVDRCIVEYHDIGVEFGFEWIHHNFAASFDIRREWGDEHSGVLFMQNKRAVTRTAECRTPSSL